MTEVAISQAEQPEKADFILTGRSPDVLTCIANLSNDEVFTPPALANQMLVALADAWAEANSGRSIWSDPAVSFLDPFTKSGVFLREITSRLIEGLKDEIPDLQERVNHILTKQVFGIAITKLTAYLARRSVYCSKFANGPTPLFPSSVPAMDTTTPAVISGLSGSNIHGKAERNGKCVVDPKTGKKQKRSKRKVPLLRCKPTYVGAGRRLGASCVSVHPY